VPGQNVEAVRRSIEAQNAGDIDAASSELTADAEWRVAGEHPESQRRPRDEAERVPEVRERELTAQGTVSVALSVGDL